MPERSTQDAIYNQKKIGDVQRVEKRPTCGIH